MLTQRGKLEKELKRKWLSNLQACLLVHSAHGDRLLRMVREVPPQGYKVVSKPTKLVVENGKSVRFLKYKLVKTV